MRRRGRSERLARSTRQGRSEPRAVQAREMLNRPILVLAPSATYRRRYILPFHSPILRFVNSSAGKRAKAVGEPASIAVRLHSLPPRAELPTQRASQGISGVSPRLDTGRNKVEYT